MASAQTDPVLTSAFSTNPLTNAIIERYMHSKVLSVAMKETVFWRLGRKVTIPKGESKTISFQRFERLTPPNSPLTEGVTPAGKAMTVSKVTAVCEQWGDFVTLTDVAELTVRHEPFQRALELIGLDAAMTVDREVQRVLQAGTNVFFPNGKTSRATLASTDYPDDDMLSRMTATLKNVKAPAYEGRRYVGVMDPFNVADIQRDSTFLPAAQYSNLSALHDAEVGIWKLVRWMESNNMPVLVQDSDANPTVAADTASSGETNLADATYGVLLVGLDSNGFETSYSATAGSQATTSQVLKITTPALTSGITAFNLYVKSGSGSFFLIAQGLDGGLVYYVNGGGDHLDADDTNEDSFQYVETGRVAGAVPPAGVNVHLFYVFGNEYYACTELSGIEVLKTPTGAQKSDELAQRRSVGWKAFFKAVITNENFGGRGECASFFN